MPLALAFGLPAWAQTVYRWVDDKGIVHYSDRAPDGDVQVAEIRLRAEVQQIAQLRVDRVDGARAAVASNQIAGPVEVRLEFESAVNVAAEPPLPLSAVLRAESEQRLSLIRQADPRRESSFGLSMRAMPGDPRARAEDVLYQAPLAGGAWQVAQGYRGSFSHNDDASRHAIDLAVAEGSDVLAARAGTVMQVERHFEGAGLDREKFGSRANHVRILHDDGSMAVYAHLQTGSVVVRPGMRVRAGQVIGKSGNTGFSTGPHLHFAVQVNRGMALHSIPFRMQGPDGPLAIPDHGD